MSVHSQVTCQSSFPQQLHRYPSEHRGVIPVSFSAFSSLSHPSSICLYPLRGSWLLVPLSKQLSVPMKVCESTSMSSGGCREARCWWSTFTTWQASCSCGTWRPGPSSGACPLGWEPLEASVATLTTARSSGLTAASLSPAPRTGSVFPLHASTKKL